MYKRQELSWNGMEHVQVNFPVIADLNMKVAHKYGMLPVSYTHLDVYKRQALYFYWKNQTGGYMDYGL